MLNKLSLWQRIAIPVLAMTLGLIIVSSMLVGHYYERSSQAQGMARSAQAIQAISRIIHQIQKERATSVLFMNGANTKDELKAQRDVVDQELLFLTSRKAELLNSTLQNQIDNLSGTHQAIRAQVDAKSGAAAEAAKAIGILVDHWIKAQASCANEFHLDGLESTLLSISIFEKSKESMGRMRALLNAVLSANQPISAATVSLLATHKSGVLSNMESPGLTISHTSHQDIDKLLAAEDWLSVLSTYNRVVEKSGKGDYGVDAKQFSATITRVIDSVRGVIDPEITMTSASIHNAAAAAQRNFILCVATVFSLIVVSMLISVYITRAINAALKAVAELLSHGADAVAKIAVQVAMASQNLASSATEQASALQETTAAVEETKSMIKKNAENSSKSATLSQQSYETALKGKEAIIDMTGSIDGIAHSNAEIMAQNEVTNKELMDIVRVIREIEGKTKVINDIVFQTRLLSFNASVEAARAGEQGKGFAVVAEEVGNLAQMSGTSAREIQILLDNSVRLVDTIVTNTRQKMNSLSQVGKEKIEAGIVTAERCGDILQQIVANVAIVGQMTNEISSACHEQSEGITEINNAMTEMDTVAHQNSAACEQTSVAAEELKTHAGKLLSMVQQLEQVIHGSVQNPVQPVKIAARNVQVEDDEWDQAA